MTIYDRTFIDACLRGLTAPGSTTAVGMRLQDLVGYLVSGLDGTDVQDRNSYNLARSREVDLWLRHDIRVSGLPFADLVLPVECKNEASPASSDEVTRLEAKVRDSGGSDGLLVARAGLAGPTPNRAAHDAVHLALARGVRIVALSGDDLVELRSSEELRELLVNRYVELRLKGTYTSI